MPHLCKCVLFPHYLGLFMWMLRGVLFIFKHILNAFIFKCILWADKRIENKCSSDQNVVAVWNYELVGFLRQRQTDRERDRQTDRQTDRQRQREREREREYVCTFVCVSVSLCLCMWVCDRDNVCVCVCVFEDMWVPQICIWEYLRFSSLFR